MTCQFENRYTLTDEMVMEYVRRVYCKDFLWGCFLICTMGSGVCGLLLFFHKYIPAAIAGFFAAAGLVSGFSIPLFFLRYRPALFQSSRRHETVVRFGERIHLTEDGYKNVFEYDQLSKICVFRTFYVLYTVQPEVIVLAASGFPCGELIPFWRFIREKRPDLRIKVIR